MPHITEAMRGSLRRRVIDIVLDSLLGKRQSAIAGIANEASSVKNSFSSWGNCMKATYCKWPVIIAIIVAALIVFSILSCIIRCACCGMSCCCSCFSFLKCCDCCGGCCDGKRDKPHKHLDDPYYPPPERGYQAPAPMMGGALGAKVEPPQYAQFEVGKNGLAVDPAAKALSEDALPPMPSWETAAKKHVLTEGHNNSVELGELDPATGQHVPLMTGAVGGVSQPPSPGGHNAMTGGAYGAQGAPGGRGNGYMGVPNDPYHQNQDPYNQNQRGYGGPQQPSRLPTEFPGQPARSYSPSPADPYASPNDTYSSPTAGPGAYGRAPQQPPYGGPQNRGLDYRQSPVRQYSSDSARPLNPGRQDSYPNNYPPTGPPRGPPRGPPGRINTPPTNNAGFDFSAGAQQNYNPRQSPPQQQQQQPYDAYSGRRPSRNSPDSQRDDGYGGGYGGSTAPPTYASRTSPASQEAYQGGGGYGQYPQGAQRRPVPQGNFAVGAGPGRGYREPPQAWDPVQR